MQKDRIYISILSLMITLYVLLGADLYAGDTSTSQNKNPLVNLKINLKLEPVPENTLLSSQDSTITIKLFRNRKITSKPKGRVVLEYSEKQSYVIAHFDSLPVGEYLISFFVDRLDLRITRTINLASDTIIDQELIAGLYQIKIQAQPTKFEGYFSYDEFNRKRASAQYSLESDADDGSIDLHLLRGVRGRKRCHVFLKLKKGVRRPFARKRNFSYNSFEKKSKDCVEPEGQARKPFDEILICRFEN